MMHLRSFQSHAEVRIVYLSTVPMPRVFLFHCCKVSYTLQLKVAETGTPTIQSLVRDHTGQDTKLDRDKAHVKMKHSDSTCALRFQPKCNKDLETWCQ